MRNKDWWKRPASPPCPVHFCSIRMAKSPLPTAAFTAAKPRHNTSGKLSPCSNRTQNENKAHPYLFGPPDAGRDRLSERQPVAARHAGQLHHARRPRSVGGRPKRACFLFARGGFGRQRGRRRRLRLQLGATAIK